MSKQHISVRPGPSSQKGDRPDRWSALALSLQHEHCSVSASSPSGLAQRIAAKAAPVSEAASAFLNWRVEQQVEFAEALSGAGASLKHKVSTEILRRGNGCPIDPKAISLLSFKFEAEGLALGLASGNGNHTPNSVFHSLSGKYPDPVLKAVLAEAFDEASELCEDKAHKRLLAKVATLLRQGNGSGGS
jgi:hypothetical protein